MLTDPPEMAQNSSHRSEHHAVTDHADHKSLPLATEKASQWAKCTLNLFTTQADVKSFETAQGRSHEKGKRELTLRKTKQHTAKLMIMSAE
jgi:hypothetical protein